MGNKWFFGYDTKSSLKKKNAKTTYEIGKNLCKTYISTKRLIYEIYKELIHSIAKKQLSNFKRD